MLTEISRSVIKIKLYFVYKSSGNTLGKTKFMHNKIMGGRRIANSNMSLLCTAVVTKVQ